MSIVGPRPPLPAEVVTYNSHEMGKLVVPQGLTGFWQVRGRSDTSWEDNVQYDLWWGPVKSAIYSCSTDSAMRRKASSGGTLTALCDYMLESGTVDGVIQVSRDPDSQIRTKSILSESPADVANCVGSRYTGSAVLSGLFESAERGKRYAVVGKPCDTRVLRAWLAKHEGWKATFPYLLSFFCGGTPTRQANERLLDNGAEVMVHIGINTVELKGKYFSASVKVGDKVRIGQKLVTFDKDKVAEAGYNPQTMVVVTNSPSFKSVTSVATGAMTSGDALLDLEA